MAVEGTKIKEMMEGKTLEKDNIKKMYDMVQNASEPEEKKKVMNRLSRAIGHLEAVKRMVERDEDCSEVLIQLAAVRSAINNTGKVILKNHLDHCIVEAIEQNDMETIHALDEAIDKFIK